MCIWKIYATVSNCKQPLDVSTVLEYPIKWSLCVFKINKQCVVEKQYSYAKLRSENFIFLCGKYNFQMPASLREICVTGLHSPLITWDDGDVNLAHKKREENKII